MGEWVGAGTMKGLAMVADAPEHPLSWVQLELFPRVFMPESHNCLTLHGIGLQKLQTKGRHCWASMCTAEVAMVNSRDAFIRILAVLSLLGLLGPWLT